MSKVIAIMSMSLDGYVADVNDGVAEVFDWVNSANQPELTGDTLRMSTFLGVLLLASQALAVTGAGLAVDTDARLRATAAAGESIVSALTAYRRDHGEFPSRLDRLVPMYFSALPVPEYGAHEWEYQVGRDRPVNDGRLSVTLERVESRSSGSTLQQEFDISVRLDPANPGTRFRRLDGCWQLPEFPKCW